MIDRSTGPVPIDVAVVEDVWGKALTELARRWSVVHRPDAWKAPDELAEVLRSARAVVVRNRTSVDRRLLEQAANLKVVARAGVGLDNIDVQAAEELGVVVVAARQANARSVAEHTVGLALCLARRIPRLDRDMRRGGWNRLSGTELQGLTWGVLGYGGTGVQVATLVRCLGMKVIAYDPFVAPDHPMTRQLGVAVMDLLAVLRAADVLSIHLPLTDDTRNLVDADFLSHMRSNAFLINVARGEIVDEDALIAALEEGHLGGVALDVRRAEPPVTGRLEGRDDVVLTPHIAGMTVAAQERVVATITSDIEAVLAGGTAEHAVTRFGKAR